MLTVRFVATVWLIVLLSDFREFDVRLYAVLVYSENW